ncbi:hypothetical protein KQI52_11870 [bacterium]|nr:hypothetical protein [bacterium]
MRKDSNQLSVISRQWSEYDCKRVMLMPRLFAAEAEPESRQLRFLTTLHQVGSSSLLFVPFGMTLDRNRVYQGPLQSANS